MSSIIVYFKQTRPSTKAKCSSNILQFVGFAPCVTTLSNPLNYLWPNDGHCLNTLWLLSTLSQVGTTLQYCSQNVSVVDLCAFLWLFSDVLPSIELDEDIRWLCGNITCVFGCPALGVGESATSITSDELHFARGYSLLHSVSPQPVWLWESGKVAIEDVGKSLPCQWWPTCHHRRCKSRSSITMAIINY